MIIVLLAKGRPGPAIATPKMPACGFSALACFRKCYILVHTDGCFLSWYFARLFAKHSKKNRKNGKVCMLVCKKPQTHLRRSKYLHAAGSRLTWVVSFYTDGYPSNLFLPPGAPPFKNYARRPVWGLPRNRYFCLNCPLGDTMIS